MSDWNMQEECGNKCEFCLEGCSRISGHTGNCGHDIPVEIHDGAPCPFEPHSGKTYKELKHVATPVSPVKQLLGYGPTNFRRDCDKHHKQMTRMKVLQETIDQTTQAGLKKQNITLGRERSSWPETWMMIARTIAKRSYDPRLNVGAIVVTEDNTQMLAVGYNGNYRGGPHEHESSTPGQSGFIHAEVNALVKCDFNTSKKRHMYVTHSPCRDCCKLIVNAGISRVVFGEHYRDPSGLEILRSAGVEVHSLEEAILIAKR